MFDLRIPSGLFFSIIGIILVGLGLFDPNLRARLTDSNVNLYAGLAMLLFGVGLLLLARRSLRS
jgi:hypothetical protein